MFCEFASPGGLKQQQKQYLEASIALDHVRTTSSEEQELTRFTSCRGDRGRALMSKL